MSENYSRATPWAEIFALNGTNITIFGDGHKTQADLGNTQILRDTNLFAGTNNPQWRDQIRSRTQAGTAASGTRTKSSHTPVQVTYGYSKQTPGGLLQDPFGSLTSFQGIPWTMRLPGDNDPSGVKVQVSNLALSRFIDSCKAAQSSVQSGQDLGELKQTLNSIKNPLSSMKQHLLGYFSSLKKAKKGRPSVPSLKKALADAYLEFNFGWNPLASDIAQAYVGLQNRNSFFDSVPVHGNAHSDYKGTSSAGNRSVGIAQVAFSTQTKGRYSVRFKGAVNTRALNGSVPAAQVLQLLPQDFVPTAWELLPYSFVADYFVNVGNIISAWSFPRSDVSWTVKTTRDTVSEINQSLGVTSNVPVGFVVTANTHQPGSSMVERTVFTRSNVSPGDLIPELQFSLPHGIKPWVNIGALIVAESIPLLPYFRGIGPGLGVKKVFDNLANRAF